MQLRGVRAISGGLYKSVHESTGDRGEFCGVLAAVPLDQPTQRTLGQDVHSGWRYPDRIVAGHQRRRTGALR